MNHDKIISSSVRSFLDDNFFNRIRQQPSTALTAVLERRLKQFDSKRITQRIKLAEVILSLTPRLKIPGSLAVKHTYWVFPILCEHPGKLMHHLWHRGFDATKGGSSLYVVEAPKNRPETVPTQAKQMFQQLLYLPFYVGLTLSEVEQLAITLDEYIDA